MKRPTRALVFLVDGFDPGYVQPGRMPRLAALMKAGASTLDGRGVLPSLTNVNHVSLLTGTYPGSRALHQLLRPGELGGLYVGPS
jgi:predicted AlkP superfamily pyrophosphatase or phosphodiesterase